VIERILACPYHRQNVLVRRSSAKLALDSFWTIADFYPSTRRAQFNLFQLFNLVHGFLVRPHHIERPVTPARRRCSYCRDRVFRPAPFIDARYFSCVEFAQAGPDTTRPLDLVQDGGDGKKVLVLFNTDSTFKALRFGMPLGLQRMLPYSERSLE